MPGDMEVREAVEKTVSVLDNRIEYDVEQDADEQFREFPRESVKLEEVNGELHKVKEVWKRRDGHCVEGGRAGAVVLGGDGNGVRVVQPDDLGIARYRMSRIRA